MLASEIWKSINSCLFKTHPRYCVGSHGHIADLWLKCSTIFIEGKVQTSWMSAGIYRWIHLIFANHTHTHTAMKKKTKIINPEQAIVVATVLDLRFFSGPNFLESNPFRARNGFDSPAVVSTLGEWIHHSKKAESFYEYLVGGFNPLWKILVKMGIFPK